VFGELLAEVEIPRIVAQFESDGMMNSRAAIAAMSLGDGKSQLPTDLTEARNWYVQKVGTRPGWENRSALPSINTPFGYG
jgi:hypothetical protein